MRYIYIFLLIFLAGTSELFAEGLKIKGIVFDIKTEKPLVNAQITSPGVSGTVLSDSLGNFTVELSSSKSYLVVKATNYEEVRVYPKGNVNIGLMPILDQFYIATTQNNIGKIVNSSKIGTSTMIPQKMLLEGYNSVSQSMIGKVAGLQILEKSGMPGEGAYVSLRGLRSFSANNLPLIVVDGQPYLGDESMSPVISGYSKDIFNAVDVKNIEDITFLKGADAARYGSLSSNGVIYIETERASSLETKVDFQTINGVNMMNKRMPMMNSMNFKTYIGDIGTSHYSDLGELTTVFPFLVDDADSHYNYLYAHDTDWQDEIYTLGFSTENMLKIRGGDAVANYALSVGYLNNEGVIEGTNNSKYTLRLNSNMQITEGLDMFTSVGFNYSVSNLAEQGMQNETNPILAALYNAPVLGVYLQNTDGSNLGVYNKVFPGFGISNAKALVSDLEAESSVYNLLVNAGLNYDITSKLKLTGIFGLYYNYNREKLFVPGKNSGSIAPLSEGIAENTVRHGVGNAYNYYINANVSYVNNIEDHNFAVNGGYQLIFSNHEFDMGQGINTTSDFYKSLNTTTSDVGRELTGYINKYNWMNAYLAANYDYRNIVHVGASMTLDASSVTGENAAKMMLLPSASIGINFKNMFLNNIDFVNTFTLRREYSLMGNSRYSSKFSRNFYESKNFRDISGLVKGNVPNSLIIPETNIYEGIGADVRLWNNRFSLSADFYTERTKDMLIQEDLSAASGFDYVYNNSGELKTKGFDISLHITPLRIGDFDFSIGGNISKFDTEIVSLGGIDSRVIEFSDGSELLSKVGESPYSFYGYKAEKVIYSSQEAKDLAYTNAAGASFEAGDMKFGDIHSDNIINDADKIIIGNPTPDFFGSFYTDFRYKNLSLNLLFTYSYGNEIYNVVRRTTESMKDFKNQSTLAQYRWTFDGQETNVHKAEYGDPMGNSRFSDKWIEDGSYLKLKNITFAYELNKPVGIFNSLCFYVTGENLFTATDYLGMDPEFSYSYSPEDLGIDMGKAPLAKSVKLGIKLGF